MTSPPGDRDPSIPPTPDDEEDRLEDLASYDILDTPPGDLYDRVTTLAAQICDAPMAAVSLIAEDRNWLKAKHGFEAQEFPREEAFCAHAVPTPDALTVVEDASEDPRFSGNGLVQDEPGVRFYAGAPLRTPDGTAIGTVCVLDTEARALSEDQAEALEALSEMVMTKLELRRTSRALQARTAELERSNEVLDKFAGLVSHELKDPLGQVLANLDLVEDKADGLDAETLRHLRAAVDGGERIDDLIRDLLAYARADRDAVEREPVGLRTLVADARDGLAERIEEADATVEVEGNARVAGDPSLLALVMENLVSNALKYGGPGPTRIQVGADPKGEMLRVTVSDDGVGIPEDEQEDVFEMFHRGSAADHDGGTGVGLALCRRLVERHGGEMGVTSTPGEGSTFWFTVPRAEARAEGPDPQA